jgi:hypothetical protein
MKRVRLTAASTGLLLGAMLLHPTASAPVQSAPPPDPPLPAAQYSCEPQDGLDYVCGPSAGEDIARVPGTDWLVVSGLNVGSPAYLSLMHARTHQVARFFPRGMPAMDLDPRLRTDCPAPPNLATLSLSGINIGAAQNGRSLLYAANTGDRASVEIFRIDARDPLPTMSWVGCVVMPHGTLPNAVVPLRDGGFLATSFYDPEDQDAWTRMDRGDATGSVWEWHPKSGVRQVDVGPISGANGVEISADERTLYVSAWSGRELVVFDRASGARHSIPVSFMPDNIKRNADGTLLVAGQRSTAASIAACHGPACPQDWIVARIDPKGTTVKPLISRPGNAAFNYASGAFAADGTLFITGRGDHRLAYVRLTTLPTLR